MRLFLAINLPDAERERIARASAPLREAGLPVRWVPPQNLHVTVRFLGSVEAAVAERVREAVARALEGHDAFDVPVGGVGAFPDMRRPRVVWIGVGDEPRLQRLHSSLDDALAPLGFRPEGRPFHPHVTLGRVRDGARPHELGRLGGFAAAVRYQGMLPVRSVDLMRSELGAGGARYERIGVAPLG